MPLTWDDMLAEIQRHNEMVEPEREYRVYHEDGIPMRTAMGPPWPDDDRPWVPIRPDQLLAVLPMHRVVNGEMISIDTRTTIVVNLEKSAEGPFRTPRGIMGLLLEPDEHWPEMDHYGRKAD